MSQRMAGCCCGKCVNAALGVCCIKPTTSTAGCLGDCEGFDPTDGTPVGILSNLTAAQCTQAGIDYGLNTVFTVYPNCAPMPICNCIESMTECACANMNGIWNGSTSCTTGCLGSCCVRDLSGQRISCHDLMTECDCNKLKSTTQTTLWTVGLNCINSPCVEPCGPDLCLGGNNQTKASILVKRTYTRVTDAIDLPEAGGRHVFKDTYIQYRYFRSTREELAQLELREQGIYPYSTFYDSGNGGYVRYNFNQNYTIILAPDCVEYGCKAGGSSNAQYNGFCSGGPTDNPYSGTFSQTFADEQYSIPNACLLNYQIGGVDWWTNTSGYPTCPVSAQCQAKLNAARNWIPNCYAGSGQIITGTSRQQSGC